MVFSFDDFAIASIARDTNGIAIPRAIITADGNSLGPGLCTYDANSDTGVLLDRENYSLKISLSVIQLAARSNTWQSVSGSASSG